MIFEPPAALTEGRAEIWIAVSGGGGMNGKADPNWGGAIIYASLDDASYGVIGEIDGPSRQGAISATLAAPSGPNPDLTSTLSVNMSLSAGPLMAASQAEAQRAVTLCLVGDELIAYAGATLTGPNSYDLSYLQRGLYGSNPTAHPALTRFVRLDESIFKYRVPPAFVGTAIYLKFQSFNIFGEQAQDLSTCAVYSYAPSGSGAFGVVAGMLSAGANADFGLASSDVTASDDFGLASGPYATTLDLGLASS